MVLSLVGMLFLEGKQKESSSGAEGQWEGERGWLKSVEGGETDEYQKKKKKKKRETISSIIVSVYLFHIELYAL